MSWLKSLITLSVLLILAYTLPSAPLDPWNLLSLKKVASMMFALSFVQVLGLTLARFLGVKIGALLTGFLGGFISSTATTASLARQSQNSDSQSHSVEILIFLSATTAMLLEGALLTLVGTEDIHFSLLWIFFGPFLATSLMIFWHSRQASAKNIKLESKDFEVFPIIKLSLFILAVLALSKILQLTLGQKGLFILTFLVSLFEIHGSVIANIQLHDAGVFDVRILGHLLAISIVASYLSKLALIFTLANPDLKKKALKSTLLLFASLLLSWLTFVLISN